MQITFTMRARLAIIAMIRTTVKDLPIDDQNRVMARHVLKKVQIPDKDQMELQAGLQKKGDLALKDWPDKIVDLDSKEADYLYGKIKSHGWGPDDDDWFEPLFPLLQAAKESVVEISKKHG